MISRLDGYNKHLLCSYVEFENGRLSSRTSCSPPAPQPRFTQPVEEHGLLCFHLDRDDMRADEREQIWHESGVLRLFAGCLSYLLRHCVTSRNSITALLEVYETA